MNESNAQLQERHWQLVSMLLGFVVVMLMQRGPAPSEADTRLPFPNAAAQRAEQIDLLRSIDRQLQDRPVPQQPAAQGAVDA